MLRRGTQEEIITMKKEILDRCIDKKLLCKEGAKILHMHPKSFSRLKWRYIREGEQALVPKKTGPKQFTPKNRTPDHIEKMVAVLATANAHLGPEPLADILLDEYDVKLHSTTVWRILKRSKIRYTREYKRWKQEPQLYSLDEPGEEIQMDGAYPYGRARKIVTFDAVDDCSRWLYGKVYTRETTDSAIDFVKHLINRVPFKIQRIRVDNRYGKRFVSFCESIGIEAVENDPYSPEQNGKVERFHGTLKRELFWRHCSCHDTTEDLQYKYTMWQNYYNTQRRHGGYKMNRMTPQEKIAYTLYLSLANNYLKEYPQKVTLTLQQYKI